MSRINKLKELEEKLLKEASADEKMQENEDKIKAKNAEQLATKIIENRGKRYDRKRHDTIKVSSPKELADKILDDIDNNNMTL